MSSVLCRICCSSIVLAALAAGCSRTGQKIPDAAPAEPPDIYQPIVGGTGLPEQLQDRPPYRLNVADVLEIIYHVKNVITDTPYDLKIEDVVKITFPYQDKFDQELLVQGDGSIRCLLLGEVRAAGRTAGDVEQQLKRGYARYIRDPELTLVVKAANVKISELKKAITTAPRGQSRLVPIKPDGTIDLPYIGEALVAGKTVNEAKRMLDEEYKNSELPEIEVTVQTLEFAPKRIYILGEVGMPGMVESTAPITLIQALTHQGGPNLRADKSHIVLIRRQFLPIPQAVVFDMNAIMTAQTSSPDGRVPMGSEFRWDMYLADGDTIYVPTNGLTQVTDWIDQVFTRGVRQVFPYSGVVGMNFGYQTYQAPSAITTRGSGPPRINAQVGP